ncbi:hypothetical protein CSPX01_14931 [Colletotrichum filicis]|nr:hypothetical protein CSPX01_14931 [Colletotrichum filicis]
MQCISLSLAPFGKMLVRVSRLVAQERSHVSVLGKRRIPSGRRLASALDSKKSGSQLLVRVFVYVPHLKSPGPLLPATNSSSFLSGIVASTMSLLPSTACWFLHFMPSANCRRLPWPHPRLTLSSDEHHATHLSRFLALCN